jgi:hypothetical protein
MAILPLLLLLDNEWHPPIRSYPYRARFPPSPLVVGERPSPCASVPSLLSSSSVSSLLASLPPQRTAEETSTTTIAGLLSSAGGEGACCRRGGGIRIEGRLSFLFTSIVRRRSVFCSMLTSRRWVLTKNLLDAAKRSRSKKSNTYVFHVTYILLYMLFLCAPRFPKKLHCQTRLLPYITRKTDSYANVSAARRRMTAL